MKYILRTGTLWLYLFPLLAASEQIGSNPPIPPSWSQHPGQSPTPVVRNSEHTEDPADRMRREQVDKMNARHQEQAKLEAAKLLELATALKQQVDALNSATTSAKTSADADRIITLAKSIKSNLRQF